MRSCPAGRGRGSRAVGFLGPQQAEGVVDRAVGHPEQDEAVVRGDQLMPGPAGDRRYVVRPERQAPAGAGQRPGPAGYGDDRACGLPARPGPGSGRQAVEAMTSPHPRSSAACAGCAARNAPTAAGRRAPSTGSSSAPECCTTSCIRPTSRSGPSPATWLASGAVVLYVYGHGPLARSHLHHPARGEAG